MMDLKDLTLNVVDVCKTANQQIIKPLRKEHHLNVVSKDDSGRNFVTQADLRTEEFLIEHLKPLLPGAGFLAEESAVDQSEATHQWIIDPIDGTTNFLHNAPPACISIGLAREDEVILGVIFELFAEDAYYAWNGGGAWCNRSRIQVSDTKSLEDSLLCTGFPYDQTDEERFDEWIRLFGSLLKKTHGVRRFGAAAVDLAYVAAGKFDGFYEYNLNPWDVAAGICIVKEAGGTISDFQRGNDYLHGKSIVASNGNIHHSLLAYTKAL